MSPESNPPTQNSPRKSDRRLTTKRVPALKPPAMPHDNQFVLTYVAQNGRLEKAACTEEVYRQVHNGKLWSQVRSDFLLFLNPEGTVEKISLHTRAPSMPGFNQEGAEDVNHLVIERQRDGTCAARHIPDRLPTTVVDEVIVALEKAGNVKLGETIGRYKVIRMVQEEGQDLISFAIGRE